MKSNDNYSDSNIHPSPHAEVRSVGDKRTYLCIYFPKETDIRNSTDSWKLLYLLINDFLKQFDEIFLGAKSGSALVFGSKEWECTPSRNWERKWERTLFITKEWERSETLKIWERWTVCKLVHFYLEKCIIQWCKLSFDGIHLRKCIGKIVKIIMVIITYVYIYLML